MNLTETPEIVDWPETHYVFFEETGPFMETAPKAWGKLHSSTSQIQESNKITGYTSLYKVGPKVYRAGVSVSAPPKNLPDDLRYELFRGGKYSRFVLTGPYSQLPSATNRVFEIVAKRGIQQRDDFCIENYLNDPRTTPEDQLLTQILVPTVW